MSWGDFQFLMLVQQLLALGGQFVVVGLQTGHAGGADFG